MTEKSYRLKQLKKEEHGGWDVSFHVGQVIYDKDTGKVINVNFSDVEDAFIQFENEATAQKIKNEILASFPEFSLEIYEVRLPPTETHDYYNSYQKVNGDKVVIKALTHKDWWSVHNIDFV